MTLESTFAEFFNLEEGSINLYFPGLQKTIVGYEKDFHKFADTLQKVKPELDIKRVGINCNRETIEARTDLDEGLVGDLYDLEYDGILFLPKFTTWNQELKKVSLVSCLSELIEKFTKGSGIFAYKVNEEIDPDLVGNFCYRVGKAIEGDLVSINDRTDSHYFIKAT